MAEIKNVQNSNLDQYIAQMSPERVSASLSHATLNIVTTVARCMTLEQYNYCRTTLDSQRVTQLETVWTAMHQNVIDR